MNYSGLFCFNGLNNSFLKIINYFLALCCKIPYFHPFFQVHKFYLIFHTVALREPSMGGEKYGV
jgi:hypothetical protein